MESRDHAVVKSPSVVPRGEIPVSSAPEDAGLEVRRFMAHRILEGAVPGSSVGLAWTRAKAGQDVALRAHSTAGLLIVLQGSAKLVGPSRGPKLVERGDVITVPSQQQYGFEQVGEAGLQALHVAFNRTNSADSGQVSSLSELLSRNEARVKRALAGPYFRMLQNGTLDSDSSRSRFRDCARVFSDAFQIMLHARQATCRDDEYTSTFLSHLQEELGHNELLSVAPNRRAPADAVLRATANWFCHQMLVLDNIEKAALVHLVIETAGYHFHTLAKPVLAADVSAEYFSAHAEADDDHKDSVLDVLQGQHPRTYQRLHRIIEDGWDMFDTMTQRIVELVELEAVSS